MKVLLFTHEADIDGVNCVVLAKLAFDDVEYVLCDYKKHKEEIRKRMIDFDRYDYIFVTDLCPSDNILCTIENSPFKNKFKVFDHHKSALDKIKKDYDFVTIKIKNDKGKCSGTSIFYDFLTSEGYLESTNSLDRMVEMTRRYDVWLWKDLNDYEACDLTYLFYTSAPNEYIDLILKKVEETEFKFNENDYDKINKWKREFNLIIKQTTEKLIKFEINGFRGGLVQSVYDYRNDIAEYLKDNNENIDFILLVYSDRDEVSYRSIKPDINVNEIAKQFGGGGHKEAANGPLFNEKMQKLLKRYKVTVNR
jgi:uncharacterized protein